VKDYQNVSSVEPNSRKYHAILGTSEWYRSYVVLFKKVL